MMHSNRYQDIQVYMYIFRPDESHFICNSHRMLSERLLMNDQQFIVQKTSTITHTHHTHTHSPTQFRSPSICWANSGRDATNEIWFWDEPLYPLCPLFPGLCCLSRSKVSKTYKQISRQRPQPQRASPRKIVIIMNVIRPQDERARSHSFIDCHNKLHVSYKMDFR